MSAAGLDLPPLAPLLMNSLRAVGYSMRAALADLLDNSVSAGARTIEINLSSQAVPSLTILDDGCGMDADALVSAMRFGSRDPRLAREPTDLGRFGLGLKTASLSQCKRFTVASVVNGSLSVARWDLDECERLEAWWLERPEPEALPADVLASLKSRKSGTVILWEKLDRLVEPSGDVHNAFNAVMNDAADHLALTFHRYLGGEFGKGFDIRLNGRSLPRIDPFLEGHSRGQTLHRETFLLDGQTVCVSPFVLPFPSRLGAQDLERAGGRENLKSNHGFYIYRGGRLVVPGGWFRIIPADELLRLARVRVELPVALDHIWKIDIRKTTAEPPPALRPHLKRIVGDVATRSKRVYTHRGTVQLTAERVPIWLRQDDRDGAASWVVNRAHPAVASITEGQHSGADVSRLLSLLESTLPAHEIYLHISNDLPVAEAAVPTREDLLAHATRLVAAFSDQPDVLKALLQRLPFTDPFNRNPEAAKSVQAELSA
ncbi:ATP-binding protein [Roseomonas populi]|uniref:ATP-binding protein n=1 Tax=Roseomonas populi TaxID=3121582 RepID=A0ABT1X5Y0_9PROT|nr:ATP-binding protein [Roseomonas pecuniae]MCR0983139.1 ATP-binding protein [Roseomonas pecuniae]